MNKVRKTLAAFLAAVIMLTSIGCSDDGSASQVSSPQGSSTITSAVSDTQNSTAQNNDTEITNQQTTAENSGSKPVAAAPTAQGISAEYVISSTWEDGGMSCSQLDFTVNNHSQNAISSWAVDINIGQNIEIVQGWNANLTANGANLQASNVEYNGEIAAGGSTSFGCILKTPSSIGNVSANAGGQPDSSSQPEQTTTAATTSTSSTTAATEITEPEIGDIESNGLVSQHGLLSVNGTDLVDKNGAPMQLRGVSTHGIQWFPQFVNKDAFKFLRDQWGINTIRLAMYSGDSEGYNDSTKAGIEQTLINAVNACIELDMYVIIDWHILADQSPQVKKTDALRFFGYISEMYADFPNVIYEICNEPNGYASWEGDVVPYANEVIPVIRANDPDSVIIVGTPTWCQDIDKALSNPLKYDNIMYALHYYAATHTDWLRDKARNCYNSGLPIFVSEFGNCDASGGGSNDFNQATKWLELIEELNLSYMTWALSDKNETCSLLLPGAPTNGGWNDSTLSENGKFMRDWFISH